MTSTEQYKRIETFVDNENFSDAAKVFENSKDNYFDYKDRVLFWIDDGLLHHYAYEDSQAVSMLQKADFAIEELFTQSISKGAASLVLNDNALDYSGEDYENLYINVFKALSYYRMGSTEDALVEIRRLIEKFHQLEDKYNTEFNTLNSSDEINTDVKNVSVDFYSSALAHYLSMILFLSDGDYDDARISRDKFNSAFTDQPNIYDFSKPNIDGILNPSGNTKLAFLSFIGKAPLKHEFVFNIDTYKNLVVLSTLVDGRWKKYSSITWYGIEGGLHAKFAVPKMWKRGSVVSRIEVYVNGALKSRMYKIESLEDIAIETFKRQEALIYFKSLARTISKAVANEALNKELDKETGGNEWGNLTRLISGAIINSTENADLRLTHYFPAFAFGGSIDLKPGNYKIEVVYKDRYNKEIARDIFDNYQISNNNINLLETVFLK